jgi:hypothetical protein
MVFNTWRQQLAAGPTCDDDRRLAGHLDRSVHSQMVAIVAALAAASSTIANVLKFIAIRLSGKTGTLSDQFRNEYDTAQTTCRHLYALS